MAKDSPLIAAADTAHKVLFPAVAIVAFLLAMGLGGGLGLSRWASVFEGERLGKADLYIPAGAMKPGARASLEFLLKNSPHILSHESIPQGTLSDLLIPWLGEDFEVQTLPLPQIMRITFSPPPPDMDRRASAFLSEIQKIFPDASLDRGGDMPERIRSAIFLVQMTVFLILLALFFCMGTVIFLSVRAACLTHRPTLDMLHLIGAEDRFIAQHLQRRFLLVILRATLLGALAAAPLLFFLDRLFAWTPDSWLLLWAGGFVLTAFDYAFLLIIPPIALLLTRSAVRHHMKQFAQDSL